MENDNLSSEDRYRAPALDKGLDILEVLADQARGLTRAEIVKELGLSPSQIYRMLERLVARGYVSRDEGGDRYALTMKMFQIASRHPPQRRLVAQAQPLMDIFARETRQSCHLVMPEQGKATVVAQASPNGHWEFRARIGAQLELFNSGSGLTLLAFQENDKQLETLSRWGVLDGAKHLRDHQDHLAQVRKLGVRIAPSRHLVGVTDISLPVFGHAEEIVAVLTCAFIQHPDEDNDSSIEAAASKLKSLAASISWSA